MYYVEEKIVCCSMCRARFLVVKVCEGAVVHCPKCHNMLAIRLFPAPAQKETPETSSKSSLGKLLIKVLGYATVAVVAYKGLQAAFDEDFGGGEFPRWFREKKRQRHIAQHGSRCLKCKRMVPYNDRSIDHIISMKNGGRTSRANAALMCRSCNRSKGARNSWFDYIRGRSY